MATVELKDNNLRIHLGQLSAKLREDIVKETNTQSEILTNYIIKKHLTGGTKLTKLAVRSGNLRRTTRPIHSPSGEKIKGGTRFGALYAGLHVGPKGRVTTIKPRKGKYLAIPIMHGLTDAGVPKKRSPRDVPDLKLMSRELVGKSPLLVRKAGDLIEPWYVLKKQVKVATRVHPDEILRANLPRILRAYEDIIGRTLREEL